MLTMNSKEGRLISAAAAAGLRRTKQGQFGVGKKKANWSMTIGPTGRLTVTRPWEKSADDLLTTHANWCGPVKLLREGNTVIQRLDVFLGQLLSAEHCMTRDDDEQARVEEFLVDLLKAVPVWLSGVDHYDGWTPPSAETLSNWLVEAGHECAIDKQDNLRFAIKRRGCDGQIRVERDNGRLRFVMLLGEWDTLADSAKQSLFHLSAEANSQSRLVRVAWTAGEKESLRCEAQVDLSGLPFHEPLEEAGKTMWGEMIRATVDGLELALRRLGLELNSLADPSNHELAEAYSGNW